jgi:hypothetical protein
MSKPARAKPAHAAPAHAAPPLLFDAAQPTHPPGKTRRQSPFVSPESISFASNLRCGKIVVK